MPIIKKKNLKSVAGISKSSYPLVFLKGFAARLNLHNENHEALDIAMRCIPAACGFVWDGDDYSKESYTQIIPHLMKKYDLVWVAAKKKSEEKQFYESWEKVIPHDVMVCLILFDDETWDKEDYSKLGISMYEMALYSKFKHIDIFCLGGGTASLPNEYKTDQELHAQSTFPNHTRWFIFLMTRQSADGSKEESTFTTGKPNGFLTVENWKAKNKAKKIAKNIANK